MCPNTLLRCIEQILVQDKPINEAEKNPRPTVCWLLASLQVALQFIWCCQHPIKAPQHGSRQDRGRGSIHWIYWSLVASLMGCMGKPGRTIMYIAKGFDHREWLIEQQLLFCFDAGEQSYGQLRRISVGFPWPNFSASSWPHTVVQQWFHQANSHIHEINPRLTHSTFAAASFGHLINATPTIDRIKVGMKWQRWIAATGLVLSQVAKK